MSITDRLYKNIVKGKQGKNVGLSTGIPKLDALTYGIQRGYVITIFGDSGCGKSSKALFSYVYKPLMEYINNNVNVNILYFSFELSDEVLLAKLLTIYIYEEYGEIISYDEVLSLTKAIDDEKYKIVCDAKSWLETIEQRLTIVDTPIVPMQMDLTIRNWNSKFGRFVDMENDQEAYILKDKESYNFVIIDHVKLAKDNGKGSKATIDDEANIAIYYRNKCQNTFIMIQQANRGFKSMDRRMSGSGSYQLLGLEDMSDSSGPAQASELVIGVYNPHREKLNKLDGYNFKAMSDNVRIIQILKSRFGKSDKNVVVNFWGNINYFKECPEPEDIDDYEKLINLKTSSLKEEKKEEVKIDFSFTL
jgi:replicative DNA helicase